MQPWNYGLADRRAINFQPAFGAVIALQLAQVVAASWAEKFVGGNRLGHVDAFSSRSTFLGKRDDETIHLIEKLFRQFIEQTIGRGIELVVRLIRPRFNLSADVGDFIRAHVVAF